MNTPASRTRIHDIEPTLIGDESVVDRFLKSPKRKSAFPGDPLAAHIARLLNLHPNIAVKFRGADLAAMDEATKKSLLEDIHSVLGIAPLKISR
jgi:hypothetical protein